MLKSIRFAAAVSTLIVALTSACSSSEQSQDKSSATPSPKSTVPTPSLVASKALSRPASPTLRPASPTPQPDRFQDALDTAMSAATITQSAQSRDDWNLVVNRWETAINLLKAVPKSSPNYANAQKKIAEYQRNLTYAQKQANSTSKPTKAAITLPRVVAATKSSSPSIPAAEPAPRATSPSLPEDEPEPKATSPSTAMPEVALATHLKQVGAKFYGTYWCTYCNKQKQIFGSPAFSKINYIECDPNGKNPRPELCIKANISSYPTWEIKGQLYRGMQSLQQLAEISGYQGDRNFRS
jgi:hypothetical protein